MGKECTSRQLLTVLMLQVFNIPEGAAAAAGAAVAFSGHGTGSAAAAFCAAGGYACFLIPDDRPDYERHDDDKSGGYQYRSDIGR